MSRAAKAKAAPAAWGDEHHVTATVGVREFGWARYGDHYRCLDWPEGASGKAAISRGVSSARHALAMAKRLADAARQPSLPL